MSSIMPPVSINSSASVRFWSSPQLYRLVTSGAEKRIEVTASNTRPEDTGSRTLPAASGSPIPLGGGCA